MRMKPETLKTRRTLTLYVPEEFIPYVETAAMIAEREGKSLSAFLWETLATRLNNLNTQNLRGALADYAVLGVSPEEVREKVKEEVAKNAAKEGSFDCP